MNAIQITRESEQFPEMERISETQVNFYFDQSERPYGEGTQYMAVVVQVEYPLDEEKEDDIEEVKALALPAVKEYRIKEIDEYDKSDAVNSFAIGTLNMWLTVDERQQIATQISANEAVGRESMSKWFGGYEFSFPISAWKQMLVAVEVYAGDALNVTESHKAAVSAMDDTDEVIAYDFTQGYPEKLVFPYIGPEPAPEPTPEPSPEPEPEPTPEPEPEPEDEGDDGEQDEQPDGESKDDEESEDTPSEEPEEEDTPAEEPEDITPVEPSDSQEEPVVKPVEEEHKEEEQSSDEEPEAGEEASDEPKDSEA